MKEFIGFPKIPRLKRTIHITEKIDGTNAQIYIGEDGEFLVGSRTRWLTSDFDNFGFFAWAMAHKEELLLLGPGSHFGEWWGEGIQRRYNMKEKVFSLFNTSRWLKTPPPNCCRVVPTLFIGDFSRNSIDETLDKLRSEGSVAAPGFMKPEGIVVYHSAFGGYFKVTLEKDEERKGIK